MQLDNINIKVGLLLASKSTIQLNVNLFIEPLVDRWVTGIFLNIYQNLKHVTQI